MLNKFLSPKNELEFILVVVELYYLHHMSPECSVFYGCSFSRLLLFLLLARHWPALAHRWEQVESVLSYHGYLHHNHHHHHPYHHKFNIITAIFLSAAFSM
jgi:Trehalose receptor.